MVIDIKLYIYRAWELIVLTRKVGILHLVVILVYRVLNVGLVMLISSASTWSLSLIPIVLFVTSLMVVSDKIKTLHKRVAAHFNFYPKNIKYYQYSNNLFQFYGFLNDSQNTAKNKKKFI